MAGLGMAKVSQQGQENLQPTPLRQRRASSPASAQPRETPVDSATAAGATKANPAQRPALVARPQSAQGMIIVLCLVFVAALIFVPTPPSDALTTASNVRVEDSQETSVVPMLDRVANALACDGPRADIVDTLAGAPYEFLQRGTVADSIFDRLPRLAVRVMKERDTVGVTRAETELQDTVMKIATDGGGWPAPLKHRLLAALDSPCKTMCSASRELAKGQDQTVARLSQADAIPLEVDLQSTSPGAVSTRNGWLHQTLLKLGAATRIPSLRKREEATRSRPAFVVVSQEPIAPRECLALRGDSSVALRLTAASSGLVVQQIVIEQLPRWVAPNLRSLPSRFEVWGEPAAATGGASSARDRYNVFLGSFAYVAAAPAAQAFKLNHAAALRGLRLSFEAPVNHGPGDFFCIYRIRAFHGNRTSCTEANGKTPARLVMLVHG